MGQVRRSGASGLPLQAVVRADALDLGSNGTPYYQGASRGHAVTWAPGDLQVRNPGTSPAHAPDFSIRQRWLDRTRDTRDWVGGGSTEVEARLRAQVGHTLGYEETSTHHVAGYGDRVRTEYHTVDMATGRDLALTDLFHSRDVYAALMQHPFVQKSLDGKKPADLDALVRALQGKRTAVGELEFSERFLSNFTLHYLEGNRVAIRLGLTGKTSGRNELLEERSKGRADLEIKLPVPAHMKQDVIRAALGIQRGETSAFGADLDRSHGDRVTRFTLAPAGQRPAPVRSLADAGVTHWRNDIPNYLCTTVHPTISTRNPNCNGGPGMTVFGTRLRPEPTLANPTPAR